MRLPAPPPASPERSRSSLRAAKNDGAHDRRIDVKRVGGELALRPLTMGHHDRRVSRPTLPERLEKLGVSRMTYSNEIDRATGLSGTEDFRLGAFGGNPSVLRRLRRWRGQRSRRYFPRA